MADNRNFAALDWVMHEIGETLKQARQSLESYVQDTQDKSLIRFCLTHIHQVHGSLQMVEFYGAVTLAEEMEQLAQALINDSITDASEAQEVLMRAILQFPIYLEQVKVTRKDNPLIVLPLLNDMRTVRGENLLSDTNLFMPNLALAKTISGERMPLLKNDAQFKAMVKKLRQMYQYAAAGFIKSIKPDENLAYLKKVFTRLYKLTSGTKRQTLWQINLALVEALEIDAIESSVSIKNLLRLIDKEIKVLAAHGVKALNVFTADELIKNLLYYVARSGKHAKDLSSGSFLKQVYEKFQLEQVLLEGKETTDASNSRNDILAAPDPEAIRSVVSALKVELETVKHTLDACMADQSADISQPLTDVVAVIKRIADTMSILGIGALRRSVLEQGAVLELAIDSSNESAREQLMSVAHNIIDIEGELDVLAINAGKSKENAVSSQADITLLHAKESVLRESRNGLEHAKDAIVEYIASKWNREHLRAVPEILRDIRGSLEIVPLPRPAKIIGACARYIEEQLLEKEITPDWETLDTLADAITSIEYYLERLGGESTQEENDLLLSVAEDSVADLGYAVTPFSTADIKTSESILQKESEAAAVESLASKENDEAAQELQNAYAAALDDGAETEDEEVALVEDALSVALEIEPIPVETLAEAEAQVVNAPAQDAVNDEPPEDEIDDEILEIFIEEAREVTEAINEFFPRWAKNFSDQDSLDEFRRAFHTLKGSGRMVGANDIGELAWSVENMLNRVLDGTITPDKEHIALIGSVTEFLPTLIDAFEGKQPTPELELISQMREQGEMLSRGEMPESIVTLGSIQSTDQPSTNEGEAHDHYSIEEDLPVIVTDDSDDVDVQLWQIFGAETQSNLNIVEKYILRMEAAAPLFEPPSDDVQRALHTLKGSAHMAGVTPVAELATPLEKFVKELRGYQINSNEDILQLLRDGVSYTHAALEGVSDTNSVKIPRLEQFIARVNELREIHVVPLAKLQEAQANGNQPVDPELLAIFMAEEMNLLLDADQLIAKWRTAPDELDLLLPVVDELEKLTKGAAHANLPPMANLGDKLHRVYQNVLVGSLNCSDALCDQLIVAHIALLDMVDAIAAGQNVGPIPPIVDASLIELLDQFAPNSNSERTVKSQTELEEKERAEAAGKAQAELEEKERTEAAEKAQAELEEKERTEAAEKAQAELEEKERTEAAEKVQAELEEKERAEVAAKVQAEHDAKEKTEEPQAEANNTEPRNIAEVNIEDDLDLEILEIFMEEADELVEDIERAMDDWQEDFSNTECVEELKRVLHTLKGGARMAGVTSLGDLAHDFETKLIEADFSAGVAPGVFSELVVYQDKTQKMVESVGAKLRGEVVEPEAEATIATPPSIVTPIATPGKAQTVDASVEKGSGNVVPFTPKSATPPPFAGVGAPDSASGAMQANSTGGAPQHLAAKRSGPQEVVKVSADLLEELVNLAGETAITRSRIEEQVGDVGSTLGEMDATIERLQEQLRRLDIETEAQVVFRQEQMEALADFDPLEMDRYSHLQQLSRSLMESASDLIDLRHTLTDKNRDTETLLLQQSRVNTELQEGLMRSRMVPFSRLVPRLRRIVRQAAAELGKEISFELDNIEGELDRTVLERMIAPLEHMLRNAVDHGIERPADRVKSGKSEVGRIVLSLGREGGDVLIRLVDDGQGINLVKVREKAIEQDLISAEAQLSDQDIMQFILHAGFSTADKVTQLSGRGVGMDVVHSEIKQLGGAMFINSRWGAGTEFTVRLPFTVSVNRALMVQIGDDQYAIPLNSIEGIVRVSPFELEHYYQDTDARFEYAGENYLVRYLGSMLESNSRPKLDGQVLPLPVVLVRSAENTVALQVDQLIGSREIVVKTLGSQFSDVQGLSGATVMGDGSVVVILDLHALIREQLALGLANINVLEMSATPTEDEEIEQTVMVVDDSVTVRKVTTRFLEREGYNVLTAKDGVEALQMLQDHMPDIMLLDIEMPRMDGFEVASNIRTSSRLKDLPIIMITSRTGDKHRERALSLGVNKYMGKPFQEDALVGNIRELIEPKEG